MNSIPKSNRSRRRAAGQPPLWTIYALLLAPVSFLIVFNYVPAISALYHAFTAWTPGKPATWAGLRNFTTLFQDPIFLKSLVNLLKLGSFVFVVNLTVPFVVAEMIYHLRSERWSYAARVALVLPMIVPGVVIFMIWQYIYSDAGLLTAVLETLNLHDWIYGWLSNPKTALWAVACVGFPFAHGFNILIYYAGLANLPQSILEAAEVDGLGAFGRILHIHIPLVVSQIKLLVVVTMIGVVNGFESIYILTRDGGPGYETMVPGLYMYLNGFVFERMGYAAAMGLLMLLFLLVFTVLINRLVRTEDYEPGT
ncbi:MAG: L-arabinose transport system permease protein AraP [Candidatus Hydrogenedentes bacterium]|nr:L-arabinose transport system permease protein AraP [Candidatus Hydrogenedentota bacterium]